jgi:hypothetical protein
LLRASFVPPKPVRELRELTRRRRTLVRERAQEANRLHKTLEDTGIKLDCVATDILGVSGRLMLDALIAGQRDPQALAYRLHLGDVDRGLLAVEPVEHRTLNDHFLLEPDGRAFTVKIGAQGLRFRSLTEHLSLSADGAVDECAVLDIHLVGGGTLAQLHNEGEWAALFV